MRSIWTWVAVIALSAVSIAMSGCSSSGQPAACGSGNSCQSTDLPCSRSCGQGETRVCECGTGTMAGMLVCGECSTNGGGTGGRNGGATGGRNGGGNTGGRTGGGNTGGRTGGGNTGGASATGGRMGGANTGGRMGGGNTGGASATGGRVGRGTGGDNGSTGGSQSSDAGTPSCPAGAEGGGVTCTATATPVCQTPCVNSLYNICTCSSGNWLCPSNQLACP